MTEQEVEGDIAEKGLTAPRVTPERVDAQIAAEQYYVPPGSTLTICVLTLLNGFTVVGESACASPKNFDPEVGRRIAREKAREKIWAFEGYRLRSELAAQSVRG